MRILFVTSEAYPLIKTGGLADVSGSLPIALQSIGHDTKILIPGYTSVLSKLEQPRSLGHLQVFSTVRCELILGKLPNTQVDVIAIKNAGLYERDGGPYLNQDGMDWHDNPLRFGVLSKVASLLSCQAQPLDWLPDIVHCNDWQSGLAPCYMTLSEHSQATSIFSIHNLAFQGNYHPDWMTALELPHNAFQMNGLEFYGQLSFLKAGLFYADKLSTVSPNYAKEIQTEAFGFGLQGLIQARNQDMTGILNGIDTQEWNPESDPHLPKHYNASTLIGKQTIKKTLQQQMRLTVSNETPLLGVVSRLTHQKGLDILLETIPELMQLGCQLVVLGSGEKTFEAQFLHYATQYPSQLAVTIGYNEPLSHLIMAGADSFVMPSRFEPCGLNQLYGLRYGTPPLVSNTGGLADSVHHTTPKSIEQGTATGFVLSDVSKLSLLVTIQQVLSVWNDKKQWKSIQQNGMAQDVGWEHSANAYVALYKDAVSA